MLNRIAALLTAPKTSLFFIGLMFFLPFTVAYHHYPIPAFMGEWLAALLGVIAMLTFLGKGFWQEVKLPQFSLVFLGLASIVIMQAMLGMLHSTQYALLVLSYIAWAFVLVVLGSYLRRELGWEKIVSTLAWFIVLGGVVNVLFVALQIATKSGLDIAWMPNLASYGALAQSNNFADYIGLSIASILYLYAKRQINPKLFWLALILFISLMAFSGSRSTWLYLGALTLTAIALQVKAIRQQNGSPNIRSLLRVGLLLIPLFAILQLVFSATLPDALITLPNERLSSAMSSKTGSLRWQFWQASWYMFTQSPWLGIGAGQMRWQSFMLLDNPAIHPSKMVFEHAHNLFLHLLTEFGVGALVLTVVGFVAWLRAFKWRELNLETWWLIALLAITGIHSMLEYPLWYTYFLGIFAFLMGAGDEKVTTLQLPQFGKTALRSSFVLFFTLSAVNLCTLMLAHTKIEYWVNHSVYRGVSTKEHPHYMKDLTWVRNYSLLSPYTVFAFSLTMNANQASNIQSALWVTDSAMRFMPMHSIAYKYVFFTKLSGNHAKAVQDLKRTLVVFPSKQMEVLQGLPMKHWQDYLDVLSEARPIRTKKTSEISQK